MLAIKCETKLKFASNVGHSYDILRQMLTEKSFLDGAKIKSQQAVACDVVPQFYPTNPNYEMLTSRCVPYTFHRMI